MSDEHELHDYDGLFEERFDRGGFIRRGAVAGAAFSLAPWVATSALAQSRRTIKIGYVKIGRAHV